MQLTKNFALVEFQCKDGTPVPDNLIPNTQKLANNLQVIREDIGEALFLSSGYRTPEYNKKINGAKNSQHPKGKAADITAKNFTPKQLHSRILKLIKAGKIHDGGLGLYKGFVHYDVRPSPARWNG
jgi:uncharacterized protein YcbK (DUF882 family)